MLADLETSSPSIGFKVSARAAIRADLLERERIAKEMKFLRERLEALARSRRSLTTKRIAERCRVSISLVNMISAAVK